MSASVANLARAGATLDDVQGDITNLHDLLDVLFGAVTDFEVSTDLLGEKGRIASLVWIARDLAKRAQDEMEANSPIILKAAQMAREGSQ